ncbi:MAG: sulfurtransferase TusA family protein [Calditrichaeota bacterium]|nr:MAG: sulfurtransferase TusA family protein [Calditrichota bacterium]
MPFVVSQRCDYRGKDIFVSIIQLPHHLASMRCGEVLELISDDPAAFLEIKAWSKLTGHLVVEIIEKEEITCFLIQKTF